MLPCPLGHGCCCFLGCSCCCIRVPVHVECDALLHSGPVNAPTALFCAELQWSSGGGIGGVCADVPVALYRHDLYQVSEKESFASSTESTNVRRYRICGISRIDVSSGWSSALLPWFLSSNHPSALQRTPPSCLSHTRKNEGRKVSRIRDRQRQGRLIAATGPKQQPNPLIGCGGAVVEFYLFKCGVPLLGMVLYVVVAVVCYAMLYCKLVRTYRSILLVAWSRPRKTTDPQGKAQG